MPSAVVGLLEALATVSNELVWLSILAFLAGAVLEVTDHRPLAVPIAAVGWVAFGLFWLSMFPYFYLEFGSPLEGLLSLAALPLSLYAAYLLVTGREQLLVVSRAIACMGLLYIPVMTMPALEQWLVETVAVHTQVGMDLVGYDVALEPAESDHGYLSRFDMTPYTGENYSTYIVLACTGIGSISIFGGLIASVRAPPRRKLVGFAAATGVIYVLNIVRNVFVGLAAPLGWFDAPSMHWLAGTLGAGGTRTSFFVAHHMLSQTLSVVALIGITLLVVRLVPEVMEPLEEVLFVLTNREYDLEAALGESASAGESSTGDSSTGDSSARDGAAVDGSDPDTTGSGAATGAGPGATDGDRTVTDGSGD